MRHTPVLLQEVLTALQLSPNRNYVDGTLGDAGHAEEILRKSAPNGQLIGIDADPEALLRSKKFLEPFGSRVTYVRDSFRTIASIVKGEHIAPIHGVLLDLGWSTPQMEERGRGFSFQKNEPLDMRYDAGKGVHETAADILATRSAAELAVLFSRFGGEKNASAIARAIVHERHKSPVKTTTELVNLIMHVVRRRGKIHPATHVFQALRIAVNDEFGALQEGLIGAAEILEPGGVLAVITFHSGEDRMVKRFMSMHPQLQVLHKKPIEPTREEIVNNPRSRSAKLRVAQKKIA